MNKVNSSKNKTASRQYINVVSKCLSDFINIVSEWKREFSSCKGKVKDYILLEAVELNHILDLLVSVDKEVIDSVIDSILEDRTLSRDIFLKSFLSHDNIIKEEDYADFLVFGSSFESKLGEAYKLFNEVYSKISKDLDRLTGTKKDIFAETHGYYSYV
ncbi:MAG: hypothetical protein PHW96_04920 [Candidatus Nanoarchaeia archaeon]|nr:hypothetical protein [Candidatus Nanoarchaeia archaeon]